MMEAGPGQNTACEKLPVAGILTDRDPYAEVVIVY